MLDRILVAGMAATLAATAAGAAHAQDFKPKAKGSVILNLRVTDVAPSGTDPITTLVGAPTGLRGMSTTPSCRRSA